MAPLLFFFLLVLSSLTLTLTLSQAPISPTSLGCNGVELAYSLTKLEKIRPFALPSSPESQPFAFAAAATIRNNGADDVLAWSYLIKFSHRELLVSVEPGVLASPFPFNTSDSPGPVSLSGFPNPDLKTAIGTANDLAQIQAQMLIRGTLFGASDTSSPLPAELSLLGFDCPPPVPASNSSISTCCVPNPNANANARDSSETVAPGGLLSPPRRGGRGDLSISYDVLQAHRSNYLAQVTISSESPRARLDNWRLSWEWTRKEFIFAIRGAYAAVVDPAQCILGGQRLFYKDLDFSNVVSCHARPTVLDMPARARTNDTSLAAVGTVPFCCRNGTVLPAVVDASRSKSAFQMEVFKMPPDLNIMKLHPPRSWAVAGGGGALNPTYRCGQPVRVAPTLYPDPSGLQSHTSAIATWRVACDAARGAEGAGPPKCCVSFSAFYEESAVPCSTCACGCPPARRGEACNATAPAMLVPPQALLVPFEGRAALVREYARLKRFRVPDPLPCGDNCGVSVNWHVSGDYRGGWSARVTLLNWRNASVVDWLAEVEMEKACDGYEAMYRFNGTRGTGDGGRTIFMRGFAGLNDVVDGANPSGDPTVPGKQQSVIFFTKKTTPGIDVAAGDGFPSKVYFNGEECSMPDRIPSRGPARLRNAAAASDGIVTLLVILVTNGFVILGLQF